MIRRTIESYTKAIEGILDVQGNPVKWFVVVRTTIWVLWVIPVISWEEDSDGGQHVTSNVSEHAGLYLIVVIAVLAFVLFMTMVLVV